MVSMHKTILISSIFLLTLLSLPLQSLASSISDFSPVSHWTCDEEGGVRYDSVTASANDLTDNNTVGFATGLLGNACDFEENNAESLTISDDLQIGLEPSYISISAWVKSESGQWGYLINKNKDFSDLSYILNVDTTYGTMQANISGTNYTSGYTGVSSGNWHYVVGTYDGSSLKFYLDSVLFSSNSVSGSITYGSAPFQIGTLGWADRYYDGLIDEITIFDYALDGTQVSTLYNSGTPLPYSGGTPPPATTTPTTTPTSSDNGDLVFMLSIIVFFLSTFWVGYIMSMFRKTS